MIFTTDLIKKDKSETKKKLLKEKEFIPGLTPFTRKRKVNANAGPQSPRKKTVKGKAARKDTGKNIRKNIKKGIKKKVTAGEIAIRKNIIKTGTTKTGIIGKDATGKSNRKRKNDNNSEDFKFAASRRRKR
jgi:hypothetical protein